MISYWTALWWTVITLVGVGVGISVIALLNEFVDWLFKKHPTISCAVVVVLLVLVIAFIVMAVRNSAYLG